MVGAGQEGNLLLNWVIRGLWVGRLGSGEVLVGVSRL